MTSWDPVSWPEEDQKWRSQAACAGMPKALFYAERGESTTEAKAVCARCPVSGPCLEFAMRVPERHGIWGGKAERERRNLRIRQNRAARQEKEHDDARGNRSAAG